MLSLFFFFSVGLGLERLKGNRKIRTRSQTVVPKATPTGVDLSSVATIRRIAVGGGELSETDGGNNARWT